MISGCSLGFSDTWMATYYPNPENLTISESKHNLSSKQECLDWVEEMAGNRENYDYECGKNCRKEDGYDFFICESTEH